MSHSLFDPGLVRHNGDGNKARLLSNNSGTEMALASDTLFDKFLLDCGRENDSALANMLSEFDQVVSSCNSNSSQDVFEQEYNSGVEMLEDLFENLEDIKQEIDIKEEPVELDNLLADIGICGANDHMVAEAVVDTIKADCMWSSPMIGGANNMQENMRKRRRDVSLTLSECAEGLLSIKDLDVDMLGKVDEQAHSLGTSPPFFGTSYLETPLASSESDTETASTTDEEEIDVVSNGDSSDYCGSARTTSTHHHKVMKHRHHHHHHSTHSHNKHHNRRIEAGRSLLLNKQPQQQQQQQELSLKQKTILDIAHNDHCYFLPSPKSPEEEQQKGLGMLTPNESSDDDEDRLATLRGVQTVDKRKIAQAVQSLIKNRATSSTNKQQQQVDSAASHHIKFKFRMKFKSNSPQRSLLAINRSSSSNGSSSSSSSSSMTSSKRQRRKSASKNAYCPAPNNVANNKSPMKAKKVQGSQQQVHQSKNQSHEDKCREIRDLHNSMERQRRVELRNNLDQLKDLVPELADTDKASKLTILKKAMDYCHLLANADSRIRREKDREASRNAMLKKKLQEAQQKHTRVVAGTRTASGRMAGWHHHRC